MVVRQAPTRVTKLKVASNMPDPISFSRSLYLVLKLSMVVASLMLVDRRQKIDSIPTRFLEGRIKKKKKEAIGLSFFDA